MNRSEILDKAKEIVCNDRQKTYKEPEDNFKTIADFWSVYLGHPVTSTDVAAMMILLKLARAKSNPQYLDNWIDICGYSGCGGEIATTIHNIEMTKDAIIFKDGTENPVLYQTDNGVFAPEEYQRLKDEYRKLRAKTEIKPGGSENESE